MDCAGNFSYTQTFESEGGDISTRTIDVELVKLSNGLIEPEALRIIEDGKVVREILF